MLNDRVVPIGNINRAVGSHLDVDRPKRAIGRRDKIGKLLRDKSRFGFGQFEMADAIGAEVIGEKRPLPVGGHGPAIDDFQAGIFRAAVVEAGKDLVISNGGLERRAGEREGDSLAARAVGFKGLAPWVPDYPPRIDLALGKRALLPAFRIRRTANRQVPLPSRLFVPQGVSTWLVNANNLTEKYLSIRSPTESMDDVMRVFRSKAGENDAALVGLARAGRVSRNNTSPRLAT